MLASRRTKARATLHLYHFFSRNFSKQQKIFQGALARAQNSCMQSAETVIYPENLKCFHAQGGADLRSEGEEVCVHSAPPSNHILLAPASRPGRPRQPATPGRATACTRAHLATEGGYGCTAVCARLSWW